MNNIIVASDLSIESATAFNYAIYMAHLTGAKLTLLHAYHLPALGKLDSSNNNGIALLALIETIAPKLVQVIKQTHAPEILATIQFDYIHTNKLNTDKLLDLIKKQGFELLVIDARPKRGIQEIVFGNYLEEVMDKIKCCPVMAVPQNAQFKPLANVWYATVMLTPNNTLALLRDFSKIITDVFHIVHIIVEPTRSYNERVNTFKERVSSVFGNYQYTFKEIEDADVETALLTNIKEENVDMMIMVERPKTTFDRMFMNSMTEIMALNATVPIIIFHEQNHDVAH